MVSVFLKVRMGIWICSDLLIEKYNMEFFTLESNMNSHSVLMHHEPQHPNCMILL